MIFVANTFFILVVCCHSLTYKSFIKTLGGEEDDVGLSAVSLSNGDYLLTGNSKSYGTNSGDLFIAKLDSDGDILWFVTLGGPEFDGGIIVREFNEGILVGGHTKSSGAGDRDILLVKFNSTGGVMWAKTYGGTDNDLLNSMEITSDNHIIMSGMTVSFNTDAFICKLDSEGSVLFFETIGGVGQTFGNSVEEASDGHYVLAGRTYIFGGSSSNHLLSKFNSTSGDVIWTTIFDGAILKSNPNWACDVFSTTEGDLIVVGMTLFDVTWHVTVFKVNNTNGRLVWGKLILTGTSSSYPAFGLQSKKDDGFIIGGMRNALGSSDVFLSRFESNGEVDWAKGIQTSFGVNERLNSLDEVDDGYLLAGFTENFLPDHRNDVFIIKVGRNGSSCQTGSPVSVVDIYLPNISVWYDVEPLFESFPMVGVEYSNFVINNYTQNPHMNEVCHTCADNFFGEFCNVTTCDGVFSNLSELVCSGHGSCFPHEICVCDSDFFGSECEISYECTLEGDFEFQGFCYHRFENSKRKLDWNQSVSFCRDWYDGGGDLVSIHTEEENMFIRNQFFQEENDVYNFWIGLLKKGNNGENSCSSTELLWSDGTSTLGYSNIFECEKNVSCFVMERNGMWNESYCGSKNNNATSTFINAMNQTDILCKIKVPVCFGVLGSNKTLVCSGRGWCVHDETCVCEPNYDYSSSCNVTRCDGVFSNDSSVCNAHGTCDSHETCICNQGYVDSNRYCSTWMCGGIDKSHQDVCNERKGVCVSPNNCSCKTHYSGENCEFFSCFNVSSTRTTEVCNAHGSCVLPNVCICDSGYSSSEHTSPCDVFYCGKYLRDEEGVCSGKGKCQNSHQCLCQGGYDGDLCDRWSCDRYEMDMMSLVCSGKGECVSPEKCVCISGYVGKDCSINSYLYTIMAPILGVVGGFAFIIMIFILICCCCMVIGSFLAVVVFCVFSVLCLSAVTLRQRSGIRRFSRLKNFEMLLAEQELEDNESVAKIRFNKALFEVKMDEIKTVSILGEGGSNSMVFKAIWSGREIAFKCFRTRTLLNVQDKFDEFEREVNVMASLNHPNVIQFFGATLCPPRVGILMEYCPKGELLEFVKKFRSEYATGYPIPQKMRLLKEVSSSLQYCTKETLFIEI